MKPLQKRRITPELLVYLGIFLFIWVCNTLTPYYSDDFGYLYSFATGERITSLWDIFPSMAAHARLLNGRLTAHFLVQFFGMFPKWVFDPVNTLMFLAQGFFICRIARCQTGNKWSCLLTGVVFTALWVYEPSFGQVNLWFDGSVNYLWGITLALGFLLPFVNYFMEGRLPQGKGRYLLPVLAFFAGAYSETVSVAALFMAALLLLLGHRLWKGNWDRLLLSMVGLCFLGYVTIYLAPAQWNNKSVAWTFSALFSSFIFTTKQYLHMKELLGAFIVLLVLCHYTQVAPRRIALAMVFFLGSLAANYMMTFASYYVERCWSSAFVLLLCADAILLQPIFENKQYQALCAAGAAALMLLAVPQYRYGFSAINQTHTLVRANEQRLRDQVAEGSRDIALPMFDSDLHYSFGYTLYYLKTNTTQEWPNTYMSQYYGVDTIIGYWPQD